ncbi:MAG: hypothetical protein ABI647_06880 [Gemmatimonadota bacterium]
MIRGLFGVRSLPSALRGGLEETSATQRGIAKRVSQAVDTSTSTSFGSALEAQVAKKKAAEEDLPREMASLADTQIRFEADAQLLKEAYGRLRTAIKNV